MTRRKISFKEAKQWLMCSRCSWSGERGYGHAMTSLQFHELYVHGIRTQEMKDRDAGRK